MKIFLKFRHWQLFTIWIFASIIFFVTMRTSIWILTFEFYIFSIVGWIYSIGKVFNRINDKKKIDNYREDVWFFLYLICAVPLGYRFVNFDYQNSNDLIIIISGVVGFFSMIKLTIFSAKAYKQYNNTKDLKISDYLNEIVLILFMFVGIWKIQPVINKIINRK